MVLAIVAVVLLTGWAGVRWWKVRATAQGAAASGSSAFGASSGASGANAAGNAAGPGGFGGPGGGGSGRRFGGANRVQPVSVASVRRQDVRVMVNAIGTIAAANTAVVHAKVDGELKALHFTEGQTVRAGQLLAELDPRPFQIALAQAQGALERDQAQLQNARQDLQRYRDLLAQDAVPKQQLDTQDALVKQLQGTVLSDQAAVDSAKLQLGYTRITAPIGGLAGLKQVDLGNMVHASDTNGVLTIAQTQPVNVVFAVPEQHLPRIRAQLKARAPLKVEAWDREQKIRQGEGQVASTDNAIDTTTGTIKLKALFPNADGALFPNQFVNVRLQTDTLAGTLAVPGAAVLRGAQGSFVYLVGADKTVSMHTVVPGPADGDWVSVQGDLKPGNIVVTDGADRLRDGAQVEVIVPATGGAETGRGGRRRGAGGAASAGLPGSAGSGAWPRGDGASTTHTSPLGAQSSTTPSAPPSPSASPPTSPPSPGALTPAAPGASPDAAAAGERPRWMDRVPPEVAEKLMKMSPEERRAWFQERRREQGGAGGDRPSAPN